MRKHATSLSVMTAMTPMIDVVFNLLIFFVVSIGTSSSEVLLPANLSAEGSTPSVTVAPSTETLPTVEIWLKLSRDTGGRTVVDMNGTPYSDIEELKRQLTTLGEVGPENPVILQIAPDVPLEDLVDVYDACQQAGFQSVSFATSGPA